MGHLGCLGVAGLAEHGPQDDPAAGREPVPEAGLPGEQVEPQFPDLPAQVPGIRLAKGLGVLGRQGSLPGPKSLSLRIG